MTDHDAERTASGESERCPDCKMFVPNLGRHRMGYHPPKRQNNVLTLMAVLQEEEAAHKAYIAVLEQDVRALLTKHTPELLDFHFDSLKGIAELESGYYYEDDELNRRLNEMPL